MALYQGRERRVRLAATMPQETVDELSVRQGAHDAYREQILDLRNPCSRPRAIRHELRSSFPDDDLR